MLRGLLWRDAVWIGAICGIAFSVTLGVAFIVVFYVAKQTLFKGDGKAIFFGYVSLLAALLITLLAFAMLRFMNYEKKWERKLTAAAQKSAVRSPIATGVDALVPASVAGKNIESLCTSLRFCLLTFRTGARKHSGACM